MSAQIAAATGRRAPPAARAPRPGGRPARRAGWPTRPGTPPGPRAPQRPRPPGGPPARVSMTCSVAGLITSMPASLADGTQLAADVVAAHTPILAHVPAAGQPQPADSGGAGSAGDGRPEVGPAAGTRGGPGGSSPRANTAQSKIGSLVRLRFSSKKPSVPATEQHAVPQLARVLAARDRRDHRAEERRALHRDDRGADLVADPVDAVACATRGPPRRTRSSPWRRPGRPAGRPRRARPRSCPGLRSAFSWWNRVPSAV